jgi:hypothetical protein
MAEKALRFLCAVWCLSTTVLEPSFPFAKHLQQTYRKKYFWLQHRSDLVVDEVRSTPSGFVHQRSSKELLIQITKGVRRVIGAQNNWFEIHRTKIDVQLKIHQLSRAMFKIVFVPLGTCE